MIDNTSQSTAKGNSSSRMPIVVVVIVAGFLFIMGVSLLLHYGNGGNTGRKDGFEESSDSFIIAIRTAVIRITPVLVAINQLVLQLKANGKA